MISGPEPGFNGGRAVRAVDATAPDALVARPLSDVDCLRLLTKARFGRIVFSRYALPAIRPVNHLIDDETIVVGTGAGVGIPPYQQMVAYEVDTLDQRTLLGWCVIATGAAEPVTDLEELARYQELLHSPLPGGQDRILRIHPEVLTGVEYLEPAGHSPPRRSS